MAVYSWPLWDFTITPIEGTNNNKIFHQRFDNTLRINSRATNTHIVWEGYEWHTASVGQPALEGIREGAKCIYLPGSTNENDDVAVIVSLPEAIIVELFKLYHEVFAPIFTPLIQPTTEPIIEVAGPPQFPRYSIDRIPTTNPNRESDLARINIKIEQLRRSQVGYTVWAKAHPIWLVKSQYSRGYGYVCYETGNVMIAGDHPERNGKWQSMWDINVEHILHGCRNTMGTHSVVRCVNCAKTASFDGESPIGQWFLTADSRLICDECVNAFVQAGKVTCDNPKCRSFHVPMLSPRSTKNVRIRGTRSWLHFCADACKRAAGYVSCQKCGTERITPTEGLTILTFWYCKEEHAIEDGWHKCDHCEEWHNLNNTRNHNYGSGAQFCSNTCAEAENWQHCHGCGFNISTDEQDYCESCDVYYCNQCEGSHARTHEDSIWRITTREPKNNKTGWSLGKPSFGIELEIGSLPKVPVSEIIPPKWGIHADGSTQSGYEFVTNAFQLNEWAEIGKTLASLEDQVIITSKEGTHLHIGNFVDALHMAKFFVMARLIQNTLKNIISPSRAGNSYCSFIQKTLIKIRGGAITHAESERYRAVNPMSWTEHGTIEIRCHQGTVNETKLAKWIELWNRIYDLTLTPVLPVDNCCTYHMLKKIDIGHEYWEARSQVLHPRAWRSNTSTFNCGAVDGSVEEQELLMYFENSGRTWSITPMEFLTIPNITALIALMCDKEQTHDRDYNASLGRIEVI